MSQLAKQRYDRAAMRRHRKRTTPSDRTVAENAKILLAWERGLLSEGQASKALQVDRVGARIMLVEFAAEGVDIGLELWRHFRKNGSNNVRFTGGDK